MSRTESDTWECVVCGSNELPQPQNFVGNMPCGECMHVACEQCGYPDLVEFVGGASA